MLMVGALNSDAPSLAASGEADPVFSGIASSPHDLLLVSVLSAAEREIVSRLLRKAIRDCVAKHLSPKIASTQPLESTGKVSLL
jgi:hypothetical protein